MRYARYLTLHLCMLALSGGAATSAKHSGVAPATPARVAYFAHMPFRESPFADLRGIYPISAEQALTYKHFRFAYDALERPIEVSFRFGNELQDLNISRNALTFAPVTRIGYAEGKETRTFFDRSMNPTLSNGVFREVYEIDSDGNRVSLTFYDVEDNRIASDWDIYAYEWTIDRRGTVTETRTGILGEPVPIRPNFPFYCVKLHYEQRGLLALMENYGKSCAKLTLNSLNAAQDKLQHNARGGTYAWNVYDAQEKRSVGNGPMVARGIMERDEQGHTVREYYEDTNGEMMTNAYGWTNSHARFDAFGNMVARFNHDSNGDRANNLLLGFSGYIIEYDDSGQRRMSLAYQNADGSPATHLSRGYHSVKTDYDSHGNQVRSRFVDATDAPVNRKDYCAAVFEYSYDSKNRRTSLRLFDDKMKPARHCAEGWHETRYHYHPHGPLSHVVRK